MLTLRKNKKNHSDWFQKSNSPRVFYSEILEAKEKRAKEIARKKLAKKAV